MCDLTQCLDLSNTCELCTGLCTKRSTYEDCRCCGCNCCCCCPCCPLCPNDEPAPPRVATGYRGGMRISSPPPPVLFSMDR